MKNKKLIILRILLVLIVVAVILTFSKITPLDIPFVQNKSENKPYIEPKIYEQFEKGEEWVPIIIKLNSEKAAQNLVASLPPSEFKYKQNSLLLGTGFAGNSTKKGIDILSKDSHVVGIYFNAIVYPALDYSVPLINVRYDVWNLNFTGEGKVICVVDTGINYSSSYLGSGWGNVIIGGWNVADNNNDTMDRDGHGTNVAGIVASNKIAYFN